MQPSESPSRVCSKSPSGVLPGMRVAKLVRFAFRLRRCVVVLCLPLTLRGDHAERYEEAVSRQDWSTAAEVGIRWLGEAPAETRVLGLVARARFQEGDLSGAEVWLERWEASAKDAPTAAMLALRGELARVREEPDKARRDWMRSYELKVDADVARRLMDLDYWGGVDRELYEHWMARVAADFQFVAAVEVTAESLIRQRNWSQVQHLTRTLNEMGTAPAMRTAASLEPVLESRETLRQHDTAVRDLNSGLALARRAHFFLQYELNQLAMEDAEEALVRAPRMVLPRFTQARVHARRGERDKIRVLRVVTQKNHAVLSEEAQASLDRLDHLVSQKVVAPESFLQRALVLASSGQPFLAAQDLVVAGPAMRSSADGLACQAEVFIAERRVAEARQAYEKALEIDGAHRASWAGLAKLAMARADYPEAIRRYQWLTQNEPDDEAFAARIAEARERTR